MTEKSVLKYFEVKKLKTLQEIEDYLFKDGYRETGITLDWKQGHGSQSWKQIIDSGNGVVFSAKDGDKYIGMIAGFLNPNIYNYNQIHGFINMVYVEPLERGKGISLKLFNLIEKWFKEHKVNYIITGSVSDSGSKFYKNVGFRHMEETLIKEMK